MNPPEYLDQLLQENFEYRCVNAAYRIVLQEHGLLNEANRIVEDLKQKPKKKSLYRRIMNLFKQNKL